MTEPDAEPQPATPDDAASGAAVESPGWDAIDAALLGAHGPAPHHHVAFEAVAGGGGNLAGVSSYDAGDHWHLVTYGLSELWAKQPTSHPEYSGWGLELTLRVPRSGGDQQAPGWAFTMLNALARHINATGAVPLAGHRIDLGRPVTGHPDVPDAPPTGLTAFVVVVDPQLGVVATPNGRLAFHQLVGITEGERQEMIATSTEAVLERLARRHPALTTDPARA